MNARYKFLYLIILIQSNRNVYIITCGAVVDLAVPDAALADDVPRLCRRATCNHRLITSPRHVRAAGYHRISTSDHCIVSQRRELNNR